jgi:integrase
MKNREEITLFRRTGKKVYYFYYYEKGKRLSASTGETVKTRALDEARRLLQTRNVETFGAFAENFFKWNECAWIKESHAYGRSFSETTAHNRRHYVEKNLLPTFKNLKLTEITRDKIKEFLMGLNQYSNQSKNHILYTLKIIMKYAEEKGLIPALNWEKLHFSLATKYRKTRGIFTLDELKKLFPEKLDDVWGDLKHGAAFYIMLTTGIRSGEARALTWSKWTHGGLMIDQAVKNSGEIGSTKTGEIRFVPMSSRAARYLEDWRALTPYTGQDALIFYGEDGQTPFVNTALSSHFGRRLDKMKFDRVGRVLCVHSLRHSYNTYLKSVLPAAMLQALTGHASESMSKNYDHPAIEEMAKRVDGARAALEELF